jgi:hypothetical protein
MSRAAQQSPVQVETHADEINGRFVESVVTKTKLLRLTEVEQLNIFVNGYSS